MHMKFLRNFNLLGHAPTSMNFLTSSKEKEIIQLLTVYILQCLLLLNSENSKHGLRHQPEEEKQPIQIEKKKSELKKAAASKLIPTRNPTSIREFGSLEYKYIAEVMEFRG